MSFKDLSNLEGLFYPKSVALLGASERPGSVGTSLLQNLLSFGFKGEVYPVNPRYKELFGLKCYGSVQEIKTENLDLAIIAIPIGKVSAELPSLAQKHCKAAIIISAGGKETGQKGRKIEEEIYKVSQRYNIRLLGPNCMGIISTPSLLNATFANTNPLSGYMAFLSQSGALCSAILDKSKSEQIGFRYFVSLGSMLDLDVADLLYYLGHDPMVRSLVLYLEYISRPKAFLTAARAVSKLKPVIVLKSGRSAEGSKAASSHTGAMAGEDILYDALFKRAGVIRVNTIQELFDCAEVLSKVKVRVGNRLAIVTNGGGPGVMAADALANLRLKVAELPKELISELDQRLPPHWSRANPIDILGDATKDRWLNSLKLCIDSEAVDGILIIYVPQGLTSPEEFKEAIAELREYTTYKPLLAVVMGGESVSETVDFLNSQGIPTFDTPERAIQVFYYLLSYESLQKALMETPRPSTYHSKDRIKEARAILETHLCSEKIGFQKTLTEFDSKRLLSYYDLPVNDTRLVSSKQELIRHFEELGPPVVLKIHSEIMTHKSDKGGVVLDIKDREGLLSAYERIESIRPPEDPLKGMVTIQPMLKGSFLELLVGIKKDQLFGPMIAFGMGGTFTEFFKDIAFGLPPLNTTLSRLLIEETKISKLLKGFRSIKAVDLDLLVQILISVSQLAVDFPEIVELDINPLLVSGNRAHIVDARIAIKKTDQVSPEHLIITPYPSQYELACVNKEGISFKIRPIRPDDTDRIVEFFERLSPGTILNRFFSPLRVLPPHMLASLTQVDYGEDIALVATKAIGDEREEILGVARLMRDPYQGDEFRMVVRDDWQGRGIGAELLKATIQICRDRGVKLLKGHVLKQNIQVLELAKRANFDVIPKGELYELICRV